MAAGVVAGSVTLVGFALDSLVESSSAGILIWRLPAEDRGGRTAEDVERRAIRLVGVAFFALAAYVGVPSVIDLLARSRPEESTVGIGLAIVSLIVMPLLAWKKNRSLGNSTAAPSRPTPRRPRFARTSQPVASAATRERAIRTSSRCLSGGSATPASSLYRQIVSWRR